MKKRVSKTIRKSFLSVLVVMTMLMATILTACGSSKAAAPSTEAETTKVETAKEEVAEPATPPETEEAVEEVAEPEPEPTPTPEDTKYAGIDMESTLPGKEWVETFDGVIEEPLLVIFNDETNEKAIIEDGEEVEFKRGDTLGVFIPKTTMLVDCICFEVKEVNYFDHTGCYNEIVFQDNLMEKLKEDNHKEVRTDMDLSVTDMGTGENVLELTIKLKIVTDL